MSATMFKAIVWKELRENLKWAVVILLGMSAVLAFAIPSVDFLLRGQGVDFNSIFNVIDATTTIGGALAGLMIGAAQTLVENRGDKWGFLAHRPIGRTTLFWGKAAAGILLYAISTGVPVVAALLRVSSPEYLPVPFDWGIALLAIANLLCGLVFYFAGFLTGMRQARWYASRALGFGAGACCIALLVVVSQFWQAVAVCAAGLVLVGTAAWSTFVAGGQYGVQPRIGRIATGVSIGLGLILVGLLALVISLNAFPEQESPPESRYTSYTVTDDGLIVRVTREAGIVEVSDPDGRPLERYRNTAPDQILGPYVLTATLSPDQWPPPSFRSSGRLFSQVRRASITNPISWYYVHHLGLLAAYDSQSRKLIGWMGPDGFSPGAVKPRPFAGRLLRWKPERDTPTLLVLEDSVYRMDLDKQIVEKVFQSEPAETILDAGVSPYRTSIPAEFGETARFDAVWTTQRVIVQRRDGTKLLEAPQDAKTLGYPILRVSRALRAPGVPTFLWYHGYFTSEKSHISEFNSAGAVVTSRTLPAISRVWKDSLPRIAISSATFPLINLLSFDKALSFDITWYFSQPNLYAPRSPGTAGWAAALLSLLVSAAAVFLHGRRYAFPPGRLITWMGIALLLGPLGYLTMLALIEWPARESCPACSRKRVVTREHCEHCGEPFAAPPQDGTEIFEPAR